MKIEAPWRRPRAKFPGWISCGGGAPLPRISKSTGPHWLPAARPGATSGSATTSLRGCGRACLEPATGRSGGSFAAPSFFFFLGWVSSSDFEARNSICLADGNPSIPFCARIIELSSAAALVPASAAAATRAPHRAGPSEAGLSLPPWRPRARFRGRCAGRPPSRPRPRPWPRSTGPVSSPSRTCGRWPRQRSVGQLGPVACVTASSAMSSTCCASAATSSSSQGMPDPRSFLFVSMTAPPRQEND